MIWRGEVIPESNPRLFWVAEKRHGVLGSFSLFRRKRASQEVSRNMSREDIGPMGGNIDYEKFCAPGTGSAHVPVRKQPAVSARFTNAIY